MFPISDSLKTKRFPYLNILLIIATVVVFFLELSAPNPDAFIEKYSLIPSSVNILKASTLQPFITAIFLHGGFLHIASNMWFLWIFGDNVEDRLGSFLFLFLYFLAGLSENVIQYLIMPQSAIPMLGASGAIAGVLGAYYIFFPKSKIKTLIPIFGLPAIINIGTPIMLGYWFILQIISGAISIPFSADGGIAFWAHVAGFFAGVLFARILS